MCNFLQIFNCFNPNQQGSPFFLWCVKYTFKCRHPRWFWLRENTVTQIICYKFLFTSGTPSLRRQLFAVSSDASKPFFFSKLFQRQHNRDVESKDVTWARTTVYASPTFLSSFLFSFLQKRRNMPEKTDPFKVRVSAIHFKEAPIRYTWKNYALWLFFHLSTTARRNPDCFNFKNVLHFFNPRNC